MTNRPSRIATKETPFRGETTVQAIVLLLLLGSFLASVFFWLLPIEVAQQWALNRAGQGQFDRFEAVGSAEFSVWLLRISSLLPPILCWCVWRDVNGWLAWITAAWRGLLACTSPLLSRNSSPETSIACRARTIGCRALLMAWAVLYTTHLCHGIGQRIHEWPYFRFNSGTVVLPNISDSNRAVIRYLQQETPPTARILVASDQKLFFLSYYLRPRTLLHRMHPDSEHVIPLKDQQRKLNAYRLADLTPEDLAQMPHDYTLEYFEHPDMVDRSQILDDSAWILFLRQLERNPSAIPPYLVRLRAAGETRR